MKDKRQLLRSTSFAALVAALLYERRDRVRALWHAYGPLDPTPEPAPPLRPYFGWAGDATAAHAEGPPFASSGFVSAADVKPDWPGDAA